MTLTDASLLPLAIVSAGGILLIVVLFLAFAGDPATSGAVVKKRLARVGRAGRPRSVGRGGTGIRRSTHDSSIPTLDRLLKALLPKPEKMRLRLARTGKKITLSEYVLITLISVGVLGSSLVFLFGLAPVLGVPLAIIGGLGLPHIVIGWMGARRINRFLTGFPEAIDLICRGLRSGLPVSESITAVGREMADPIGVEFRAISDGVRLGQPLEQAMWDVARRLDCPEFKFLIIAMAIQRETGGNLAETLGNLADLLRKRRQLKLKIKAMSSEARASAWIIGSLPFLMFAILMFLSPDYVMDLFRDPRGLIMVGIGLGFIVVGVLIMAKMIRFEI